MRIQVLSEEQKQQLLDRSWKLKLRDFVIAMLVFAIIGLIAYAFVAWIYRVDANSSFPVVQVGGVIMSILGILTAMIKFN